MGLMEADGSPVFDPSGGRDALERRYEIDKAVAASFDSKIFEDLPESDKRIVRSLQGIRLLSVAEPNGMGKSFISKR